MHEVEVVDYSVNGVTGHMEVVVCAVSEEGGATMRGPIKKYGVDAALLKSHYGGDVMQWLQFVKQEHQAHHGLHNTALDALAVMKGKRI